ncbi:hypothetical protein PPERSA_04671 [Pseudocohnilembus persalinus]|uniref:Uncharacterized protein n=1 Tax=Pseudocohnilembus persalinus TaxID=266149 RepID=A0A0V0R545_PSEPJ|nr:hypothetical protein PPERSA_04671 [Pseudocohnilembus persalinus]|eukprot:KRX09365.1 hypothetical protein PPERSA_04671 [Pseudocohnilembus persalinus]
MLPSITSRNHNQIRYRKRSRSREQELKIKYSQNQQDEQSKSNTINRFDKRSNKSEITERQSQYDSDLESPEQQIKMNLINSKERSQDDEFPNNQQDQIQNNNYLSPCEIDLEANKKFLALIEEKNAKENIMYLQQNKEQSVDIKAQTNLIEYERIELFYGKQISQKQKENNNKQQELFKIEQKIDKLEYEYQRVDNQQNESNKNIIFPKDINYKNQKLASLIEDNLLNLKGKKIAKKEEIMELSKEIQKLKSKKMDELNEKVNEHRL